MLVSLNSGARLEVDLLALRLRLSGERVGFLDDLLVGALANARRRVYDGLDIIVEHSADEYIGLVRHGVVGASELRCRMLRCLSVVTVLAGDANELDPENLEVARLETVLMLRGVAARHLEIVVRISTFASNAEDRDELLLVRHVVPTLHEDRIRVPRFVSVAVERGRAILAGVEHRNFASSAFS